MGHGHRDKFLVQLGIWGWGLLLAVWLISLGYAFCWGARYAGGESRCVEASYYCVIERNGSAVAAITAVLGVIWSWFFQMGRDARSAEPPTDPA